MFAPAYKWQYGSGPALRGFKTQQQQTPEPRRLYKTSSLSKPSTLLQQYSIMALDP